MKKLLIVTAVIELGAGVALLAVPSGLVWLLVGSTVDAPAAQSVARVGGAALVALCIACFVSGGDAHTRAARGMVAGMLFYNIAVVAILIYTHFAYGMRGIALWPAVVLHVTMAGWCVGLLVGRRVQINESVNERESLAL